MQDMYLKFQSGAPAATDETQDPFWDPVDDYFLGSVLFSSVACADRRRLLVHLSAKPLISD
jgi:hypothetical protein